jgi:hypothetical protein
MTTLLGDHYTQICGQALHAALQHDAVLTVY